MPQVEGQAAGGHIVEWVIQVQEVRREPEAHTERMVPMDIAQRQ